MHDFFSSPLRARATALSSPPWHRRERLRRASCRASIRRRRERRLQPLERHLRPLEGHHSQPRYRRSMGKRGGGWHTDNQKWQLWGGAKSPSQRPWRYGPGSQGSQGSQGFQDSRFPAFDAEYVELPANGHEIAKKEFDATGTDDGAYSMLQDLQSMLNNARKAENRVAKACKSRELTKAQWQRFEEKLRQTY